MNFNSYRDLLIWQKSMKYVTKVYKLADKLPDLEKYGLISQIKRSAVSIPSNIAEGYSRKTTKDFNRFLNISLGLLYENNTQILISTNLNFISNEDYKEINILNNELIIMINSLISKLKQIPNNTRTSELMN